VPQRLDASPQDHESRAHGTMGFHEQGTVTDILRQLQQQARNL
jgi:hypothetical protein